MKKNGKRILSFCLAAVIAVTTVWYAPPLTASASWKTNTEKALELFASPSEATKQVSEATPSEAEKPGREATPSESEIPDGKATPSQAVKKFVRVDPEEIPEYYSKVSASGKRFWKFEDRFGTEHYRDYGYLEGDIDFPLWYELNDEWEVETENPININLDDEYYDLAPYIYESVIPTESNWSDLSSRLLDSEDGLEEYSKEKIRGFENWDSTNYDIWKLEGDGDTQNDLGCFFYGSIVNDNNSSKDWHYADEDGNVLGEFAKENLSKMNLLAKTNGLSQVKYYYANKETYPNSYTNYVSYIDDISKLEDDEYYEFKTPPALSGHKFLGWSNWQCYEYGEYKLDIRMNPQNYNYDSHVEIGSSFAHLIMPGTKILKKYLKWDKLTAVWIPDGYETLVLLRDFDMMDPTDNLHTYEYKNDDWEKAIWTAGVVVRKPGVTFDLTRLPGKNYKYHSTKFGADMGDWITEDGERIVDSYTFKNKAGITYAYAEWIPSENCVTFKDYYGNVIGDVQTVITGNAAVAPEPTDVPTPTGYVFVGWDKDFNDIREDTVITAQYETATEYKLTLDGNGGTIDGDEEQMETVTYGSPIDQILIDGRGSVSREYCTFAGWYTEESGGSKYPESGNLMPDGDLIVYAHWKRSSSEVTFKDWNGTILDNQEVALGADATPPKAPERIGYTFAGWDKSYTNIQDHTTITARYTINGYLLTLDGNGGTLEGNARKEQVLFFNQSFDQALKDGKNIVSRPGYSFDGWYNSVSGGSSYFYSGNQMPAANVTVFAHWTPNTYKVTFNPDHVRWTGGTTTEELTFDTRLGTLPTPELYGWRFTGWWTGKNGTGTKVTNYAMVEPRDAVYYGKWEPETYQIRFITRAEQPEGESVQNFIVNLRYDQALGKLPVPEEKGYTFIGWYDEDNKKVDSQTIFNPDSEAEGCSYHAGWKANTYKIRFVYNDADGKSVIKEIDGTYGTQYGTLPNPEKPGYTFVGWFKDNGEEVTAGSWVESGDTEYKARWSANQYTIHFEWNLPELSVTENPEDKIVTYGFPIGKLPILQETGYLFLGWYTEPAGGNRIKETTFAALGTQTYYAHWATGWIENGNGTYNCPGADGVWNTEDDEIWWNGPDGISGTDDDKLILIGGNGADGKPIYYVDNGDGTHIRSEGDWNSGNTEHWWNGADGKPGTEDDKVIQTGKAGLDGIPIYYVDNGDGTHTRPGADGSWEIGDVEIWNNGPDGLPGTDDDYKKVDIITPEPTEPEPVNQEPTKPEPINPEPSKESEEGEEKTEVTTPVIPVIDSNTKPEVPDTGGTFTVNPDNPYDVTYIKSDGTSASDEWVGDGEDWYHVDSNGKLNYDWYLDGQKTWYKLNKEPGDKFGAALTGWNYEPMDDKKYFFEPKTTEMLTGWQHIDNKWYYFTTQNEAQTYYGSNRIGWKYDPTKPGKPYGSMYQNEKTPDGYRVDENGIWIKDSGKE